MRAAILVEQRAPLIVDDIELPEPEYGQVLVDVYASGVCGSQIGEIDGVKGPDRFLPHLLGHEGGGVVARVGPGVTRVREGDRVVLHWRQAPGIQAAPPKYRWRGRTVNAGWVTTFNEQAIVSENRLTPVPEDVDFETAALMGCAVTTGFGAIENNGHLKIGQSIAIFGVGGVGLPQVAAARLRSARPIIAIDLREEKLALARTFGATHAIDASREDAGARIREIAEGGVDVAIDNTGDAKVIETAYEVTAARGRTILVGVLRKGERIGIHTLPLHFGKVLTGSHGGESQPADDIPRYLRLARDGLVDFRPMVTHRWDLDSINEAIDALRAGRAGRPMIRIRVA